MGSFLLYLHEKKVHNDEKDRVLWTKTNSGKFFVNSLYKALELDNSFSFPMKRIWKPKVTFLKGNVRKSFNLDQI